MSRGNQREKAREKNLKADAGKGKKTNVRSPPPLPRFLCRLGEQMSGSEFQKHKEDAAAIMRAKQAAGWFL